MGFVGMKADNVTGEKEFYSYFCNRYRYYYIIIYRLKNKIFLKYLVIKLSSF